MAIAADLILCNGTVLTMDPERPRAEIVALKGNRILAVGQYEDLWPFKGLETKIIDCQGKAVVPGFNDAHCHPLALASGLLAVDCRPTAVRSIVDLQHQIRQEAQLIPEGTWIKAVGYNEYYLAEKRHPTRWELDEAAPHHPVKLGHRTGHACVLNSLALRLADISAETEEPEGGLMERHLETGEPTGVLFGMNDVVEKAMPPVSQEEKGKGIRLANQLLLSQGITSVTDASWTDSAHRWETYREMQQKGILQARVSMMIGADIRVLKRGLNIAKGDEQLRLGPVKIVIDEVSGALHPPQAEINRLVAEAHQEGFQVALHCVEENTVEAAIIALEEALKQLPRADHRHRLEHCSVCPPHLAQRIKALRTMVVTQPLFLYHGGERYLDTVPAEQLPYLYTVWSWIEKGIVVAAGSDTPVVPLNSLESIYAAVSRRAQTGQCLRRSEGVAPERALHMHTLAGAYSSFEEEVKGSLSPGKLADIAILSADPTTALSAEDIKDLQVLMTIIDGQVVWEK